MIINDLKDKLPPLPLQKGKYRVIYLEPIRHSGERLSIGIMAESGGDRKVIQTISPKKLTCMYGKQAKAIQNLVGVIMESVSEYLNAGLEFENYEPPFTGVYLGKVQKTRFQNSMDNLFYQAVTSYSSLYDGQLVESINSKFDIEEQDLDEATAQLITSVKNNLGRQYHQRFRKKVSLLKGDKITIDYLGVYYNADIANFDVSIPTTAERNAKAKLLDIVTLRDERSREKINSDLTVGFMLLEPSSASERIKTSIRQVIHMAESRDIPVDICSKPEQMAEIITKKDPLKV